MTAKPTGRLQIAVVGPAPGQAGGISSVMSYLQANVDTSSFDLSFVNTLKSSRWSFGAFAAALVQLSFVIVTTKVKRQPLVVHLNVASRGSTYRKWILCLICRVCSVPYVCHLHGARYRKFFANANPVIKWLVIDLFGSSAKVIVLGSPWVEHVTKDLGVNPEKVVVVFNGTTDFFNADVQRKDAGTAVRIAFSGRLEQRKGLKELLQACDELQSLGKDFELILMGDSRDPELLQNARNRDFCRVTGWLDPVHLRSEIASADIFVLPSRDEGLPMAMIEAMSVGLPVIVTPVGGIPDVVADGREGLLVPIGEVSELAKALLELIDNEARRIRMGKEARSRWESVLTAKAMTNRIESIWRASAIDQFQTVGK